MKVLPTQIAVCFSLLAALGPTTSADTVVLRGKPPFRSVHVLGFERGLLQFRGVSREVLRKPLGDIASVKLDSDPMLSNAEALAAIDPNAAVRAYKLALADSGETWIADFCRARLVMVYDRAGRFDDAVKEWLVLLPDNADWVAELAPRKAGDAGSSVNRKARKFLSESDFASRPGDVAGAIRSLWLELALLDGLDPLPPELVGAASRPAASPEPATASTTQPADLPPLMFGPPTRKPTARGGGPTSGEGGSRLDPVYLPRKSLVLARVTKWLQAGSAADAARLIERASPFIRPEDKYSWRILAGRCDIELGHAADAARALLAISQNSADAATSAEALYYAAAAYERMSRADDAARIYRELAKSSDLPAELRRSVEQRLKEIGD